MFFIPLRGARPASPMRACVVAVTLLLAGCASLSDDGGFGEIDKIAGKRLHKQATWSRTPEQAQQAGVRTRDLLHQDGRVDAQLAGVDDAVQIALFNNPDLQAAYAELGIAEADLVQAGRLPNPGFSFARTHAGDDLKIERSLSLSLLKLITLPATSRIEQRHFEQTRLRLADQMLKTAAQTRQAYYRAVAAQQGLTYQEQVRLAAEAAHQLAEKMAARGNSSQLDAAREQLFYAESEARLVRARKETREYKEALARLLGIGPDFALPSRLPDLPKQVDAIADVEQVAMTQRLDVQAARMEIGSLQQSLGLTKSTRFINVLDLGYLRTTESGKAPEVGYEVSVEIPIFDWGQARVAKAEAVYMQSVHKLAAIALDAQSQVRLAYRERQDAFALARRYQEQIVPLRKRIAEENLLRYNGMLISVFELLADAREQAATINAAIDANRDYWLADAGLQLALGGPAPSRSSAAPATGKQP